MRLRRMLILAVLLLAAPARADQAGFAAARAAWLAGDEAAGLGQMAAEAVAGDPDARLFLGLIDSTALLQGDWLMQLPRPDRIALLRQPGGLSGQSWLAALPEDPVAAAWLHLWSAEATPQIVLDFAALGEPRAARVAALALAARQVKGFAAVADDPAYPEIVAGLALREWPPATAATHLAALAPGDPQRLLYHPTISDGDLAAWLMAHAEGDPLLAFCAAQCGSEPVETCLPAAFRAVGGYPSFLRLGSPFEALVSSPDYNRSTIGLQATHRRMQQWTLAQSGMLPPSGSACIDAVAK